TLKAMAFELWADLDGSSRTKRQYGKGTIAWGMDLAQLLAQSGIAKDAHFDYDKETISWIHRRDGNTHIYFIVNRSAAPLRTSARFNVTGKEAELWRAHHGTFEPASYDSDSIS